MASEATANAAAATTSMEAPGAASSGVESSSFWDNLYDAHNEVMNAISFNITQISEDWRTSPGFLKSVNDFIKAVAWSDEPNFLYLAAFHAFIFLYIVFYAHKTSNRIIVAMVLLYILVFSASYLNEFGRRNYKLFFPVTETNYFDEEGFFISMLWSGPLVVYCFLLQIKLLFMVGALMIKVKRAQLLGDRSAAKKNANEGSTASRAVVDGEKSSSVTTTGAAAADNHSTNASSSSSSAAAAAGAGVKNRKKSGK